VVDSEWPGAVDRTAAIGPKACDRDLLGREIVFEIVDLVRLAVCIRGGVGRERGRAVHPAITGRQHERGHIVFPVWLQRALTGRGGHPAAVAYRRHVVGGKVGKVAPVLPVIARGLVDRGADRMAIINRAARERAPEVEAVGDLLFE